jgi:hypothetical protein
MSDDFYIGYLDDSPRDLARHTRWVVAALCAVVVISVAALAALQSPPEPGVFEFGVKRTFEGILLESPLPMLRASSSGGSVTNYLLVGAGKHGLPAFARGHDGQRVRFDGTLIQKGSSVMVELNDANAFSVIGPAAADRSPSADEIIGSVLLKGELVDTKCYFGVMRPATGKVHRGCAVRCLSGGVPPGLLVRDADENGVVVLLIGIDGKPLQFDVGWAARLVEAEGELSRQGDDLMLAVSQMTLAVDPR